MILYHFFGRDRGYGIISSKKGYVQCLLFAMVAWYSVILHYCLTDLTGDSNDITVLVLGEQKQYFHLWGQWKQQIHLRVTSIVSNFSVY
jgi:hypothetical protein